MMIAPNFLISQKEGAQGKEEEEAGVEEREDCSYRAFTSYRDSRVRRSYPFGHCIGVKKKWLNNVIHKSIKTIDNGHASN